MGILGIMASNLKTCDNGMLLNLINVKNADRMLVYVSSSAWQFSGPTRGYRPRRLFSEARNAWNRPISFSGEGLLSTAGM